MAPFTHLEGFLIRWLLVGAAFAMLGASFGFVGPFFFALRLAPDQMAQGLELGAISGALGALLPAAWLTFHPIDGLTDGRPVPFRVKAARAALLPAASQDGPAWRLSKLS